MESRTVLLIAAALWAALAYAGDLWALVRTLGSGVARLFTGKAKPDQAPLAAPVAELVVSDIDREVEAFQVVMPKLSAAEASTAWARLEPIGPRIDSPKATEPKA